MLGVDLDLKGDRTPSSLRKPKRTKEWHFRTAAWAFALNRPRPEIGNRIHVSVEHTVKAVDQFSAAHAGLEKFATCMDRLRFNFARHSMIAAQDRVLVTRKGEQQRHRVVPIRFGVPNPEHHLDLEQFIESSRQLDELFHSGQIDGASRRRIEAATRHYRLGRDGRSYHDMLLNWWMGLETLTNAGDGRAVGPKVVNNAVPLIVHRYMQLQLTYLAKAVYAALGGGTPPEVLTVAGHGGGECSLRVGTEKFQHRPSRF